MKTKIFSLDYKNNACLSRNAVIERTSDALVDCVKKRM